jgi:lipopolysaccharide/colanic/teichoic acid biosynthesis glycosyltransferase
MLAAAAAARLGAVSIGVGMAAWLLAAFTFGLCGHRWWGQPGLLRIAAAKTWAASSILCLLAVLLLPPSAASLPILALPLAAAVIGLTARLAWRAVVLRSRRPVLVVDAVGEPRLKPWVEHFWPEWRIVDVYQGRDFAAAERQAASRGADLAYYLNGEVPPSGFCRREPLPLDELLERVSGRVLLGHEDRVVPPSSPASTAAKRAIDVCAASAGLIALSPLMAVLAALIRLESEGPALYRQERVGQDGRPFRMLKFRSMVQGAEGDSGPVWAQDNDPRCTSIGRILRPLHLDELPQLLNVLRGEMSLVGPRPERLELTAKFAQAMPAYRQRLLVKPGVTGWAQINQGYDREIDDVRRKLEYDLYYVKHAGPLFDLTILLRTADVILFGKPPRPTKHDLS